jgi:hypothetical protein
MTSLHFVGWLDSDSGSLIFQLFQNIFSFRESGCYHLISHRFSFSRKFTAAMTEKLFHCVQAQIVENAAHGNDGKTPARQAARL